MYQLYKGKGNMMNTFINPLIERPSFGEQSFIFCKRTDISIKTLCYQQSKKMEKSCLKIYNFSIKDCFRVHRFVFLFCKFRVIFSLFIGFFFFSYICFAFFAEKIVGQKLIIVSNTIFFLFFM